MFSKCGMPWRSSVRAKVLTVQTGCVSPSQTSRAEGLMGMEKPFRSLFSRLAGTGTSTVSTKPR